MKKSIEDVWKEITYQATPTKNQDPNTATFSGIFLLEDPPASFPPSTLLTLNSSPQLSYQHAQQPHHQCNGVAFAAGASSFCKKRMAGQSDDQDHRQKKRLIKNREAADKSRAKKQAYIDKLELKLNHLVKENAKLRKEQQKRWLAAELDTKKKLHRTLSAPF